jgi:hypothetical protein
MAEVVQVSGEAVAMAGEMLLSGGSTAQPPRGVPFWASQRRRWSQD